MTTALLTVAITWLLRCWRTDFIRNKIFSKIGTLPRTVQWIPPVIIGMLVACGQSYLNGLRGTALLEAALQSGGELGLLAIGLWHSVKRLPGLTTHPVATSAVAPRAPIPLPIQLVSTSNHPPPAA